jgi:hypothetical protein
MLRLQPKIAWRSGESMSLAENTRLAVAAFNHTKSVVSKGADNRPDDVAATNGFVSRLPASLQSWLPESLRPQLTPELADKQRDEQIFPVINSELPVTRELEIARIVAISGIGRCGEQSAVAFTYLLKHADSIPFGIAHLKDGNHEFVIIGVEGKDVRGHHALAAAPAWPSDAVILDCWAKLHFAVAERWTSAIPMILKETKPGYSKDTLELIPITFHKWNVNPAFRHA